MSKEKRRVPKLRFPGFTEDWEQRKLTDIAKTFIGLVTTMTENYRDSGTLLIRNSDIKEGQFIFSEKPIHLDEEFAEKNKTRRLQIGDVVTVHTGDIGTSAVIKEKEAGAIGFATINTRTDKRILNPYFLSTYFNTEKHKCYANSVSTGDGRSNYNIKDFNKLVISIPTLDEQEKISALINNINTIITLHQRKLEHLNLKKKALLQNLFPKNGERYPELRFPGFTDAWEQRKLGSIGSTYTGLSGKTKEDFGHGEAQYITYLNVFQNTISNITMTDKVEIDPTQNEVKYGDVLFTTSSETPEEVGMSSVWLGDTPNIYLNSFCFGFRPNQKIDSYFLGYSLRAPYMRDKIKILAQGISRYNISKNKVMELEISLPNNEEQKLLGTFLQRIDLIITLHQRKLEHLQLQKKALLQQMFV